MSRWLYTGSIAVFFSVAAIFPVAASAADATLEQRQLYRETTADLKRHRRPLDSKIASQLADYPLLPYLQKTDLSRRLNSLPVAEVDEFLAANDGAVVAVRLRHQWLRVLARKQRWDQFLIDYRADEANTEMQCNYLEALYQTDQAQQALDLTAPLWLNGHSLPDACDRSFQRWEAAGLKSDELLWRRLMMALAEGNPTLAHYISRKAPASINTYTRRLMRLHSHPDQLAGWLKSKPEDNRFNRAIAAYSLKRLTKRDYRRADELRHVAANQLTLNPKQLGEIRQAVGRQIIASDDNALQWLMQNDPDAEDAYLLEWRIRLALKNQVWTSAQSWIALLPDTLQQSPRWQYWMARSLAQQPQRAEEANAIFHSLAEQRHYYGFMAAKSIGHQFEFNHQSLALVEQEETVDAIPAIRRARELYALDDITDARREWYSATRKLDRNQLRAATALAHNLGWHNQAIRTTILADDWDDMDVRFPLAFEQTMRQSAQTAQISTDWLYAIARQESAFASDARSPVGARGLMQLMPATAETVAKSLGLTVSSADLYQPATNIRLGSSYLKQLLDTFGGDPILATAAYNAGPSNVKRWLKQQPRTIDTDIWIETLPYYETRDYVQNVLAFSVIYSHKMGQKTDAFTMTAAPVSTELQAFLIEPSAGEKTQLSAASDIATGSGEAAVQIQ